MNAQGLSDPRINTLQYCKIHHYSMFNIKGLLKHQSLHKTLYRRWKFNLSSHVSLVNDLNRNDPILLILLACPDSN